MSGFYRLELGSHFGCACAHPDGETLVVDEILPDCSVLPALLKQLPAKQCRVRTVGGSAPFAHVQMAFGCTYAGCLSGV